MAEKTERELTNWAQEGVKWNTLSAAGKAALHGAGVAQSKADGMSSSERISLLGKLSVKG